MDWAWRMTKGPVDCLDSLFSPLQIFFTILVATVCGARGRPCSPTPILVEENPSRHNVPDVFLGGGGGRSCTYYVCADRFVLYDRLFWYLFWRILEFSTIPELFGATQIGGNTGSPCMDNPLLPCRSYHGTHVAVIIQPYPHDYKRVSNSPACTPEHKST